MVKVTLLPALGVAMLTVLLTTSMSGAVRVIGVGVESSKGVPLPLPSGSVVLFDTSEIVTASSPPVAVTVAVLLRKPKLPLGTIFSGMVMVLVCPTARLLADCIKTLVLVLPLKAAFSVNPVPPLMVIPDALIEKVIGEGKAVDNASVT